MRVNYVLIDFENVQPDTLGILQLECFRVLVFVGANQTKLTFDIAEAIQRMGDKAQYIKISGNGSNALDFHIAFYIGQLSQSTPDAFFHIISKDTGFDPLVKHLKTKGILASRVATIQEIPLIKAATAKTPAERLPLIIERLKQLKASRPRTVKTLSNTISSAFQKKLTDDDITALLQELKTAQAITIQDTKVSYNL
jgi:hypothetical protein